MTYLSPNAIFDPLYLYQKYLPRTSAAFPPLKLSSKYFEKVLQGTQKRHIPQYTATTRTDLSLLAHNTGGGLRKRWNTASPSPSNSRTHSPDVHRSAQTLSAALPPVPSDSQNRRPFKSNRRPSRTARRIQSADGRQAFPKLPTTALGSTDLTNTQTNSAPVPVSAIVDNLKRQSKLGAGRSTYVMHRRSVQENLTKLNMAALSSEERHIVQSMGECLAIGDMDGFCEIYDAVPASISPARLEEMKLLARSCAGLD